MPEKKTHEEYIVEVNKINPNIEVVDKYVNANTKILHRCKIDDYVWYAVPNNILNGKGCPQCGIKSRTKKRSKTHDEYVLELSVKNPNVEVIGQYSGANTKIQHHCLIHDVYWYTTPSRALQGVGCELCHNEKISASKYKTHEQYVDELSKINPNIIVVEKYTEARVQILHKCTIHNVEWLAYPDSVLHGCGCPKCGGEKIGNKLRKTHEQYVEDLKTVNRDIIPTETYIDSFTPILHRCLIDGNEWYAKPANILSGRGCPQCSGSHGEKSVKLWLDNHSVKYKQQKTFDDCKDKNLLPFDFYLPDYNCCIEYDGEQHYRPVDYFGGENSFKKTVMHDKIKNDYCKDNNIKLLRISYFANVDEELNNFLFI
jgi:hypothetical protein